MMSLPLLASNVTDLVVTPFLRLELMPQHYPDWGRRTNNNWIRLENEAQMAAEELSVVRHMVEGAIINLRNDFVTLQSSVQNEAILRSSADAFLQGQINAIPTNLSLTVRFVDETLIASIPVNFNHDLGVFPRVAVIRQIGAVAGIDVTGYFDTVVTHNSFNQIVVSVGVSGLYTIICNS
jgi:hypothetical protein